MPFVKGHSGNPGGRPKGTRNHATIEIKALTMSLFDAEYWGRIRRQLRDGTLHPSIEARLLTYAYGEPRGTFSATPGISVSIGFMSPPRANVEVVEGSCTTVEDRMKGMSTPARLALRSEGK